jgi:catechol 2,3-dioxygenase-like lactoylglutathione lyase family enzyme
MGSMVEMVASMQNSTMIGDWHGTVIDCEDPSELARFYEALLGYTRVQDESDWVVIGKAPDFPGLAFQRVEGYRPPQWPDAAHPAQMHLDIRVDDLQVAATKAQALGARLLSQSSEIFWVFADPAGHPFCIVHF